MAKADNSTKRVAISRANAQMVAVLAVASFVTVFCLFAAKAVWSQNSYQSRIISAKELANNTLEKNLENYSKLASAYNSFNKLSPNVIGGVPGAAGDNDGNNAKIILDSLPSSYDFPALTSSIEKLVLKNNLKLSSITGVDDQVNQQNTKAQATPKEVAIPFAFAVEDANYSSVKALISSLERSIRPIQIDTIEVSGGGNDMTVTVNAHTYYQPAKDVSITKKVIK